MCGGGGGRLRGLILLGRPLELEELLLLLVGMFGIREGAHHCLEGRGGGKSLV